MSKLAMDDTLEMHLRRLASIKFRLPPETSLQLSRGWLFMHQARQRILRPFGWWQTSLNTARRSTSAPSVFLQLQKDQAAAEIPEAKDGPQVEARVNTALTLSTRRVASAEASPAAKARTRGRPRLALPTPRRVSSLRRGGLPSRQGGVRSRDISATGQTKVIELGRARVEKNSSRPMTVRM